MDLNRSDRDYCPDCGQNRIYHAKHDTFYCYECDQWLEGQCEEGTCIYCQDRPERPSEAAK
jgi:hypothetical protein